MWAVLPTTERAAPAWDAESDKKWEMEGEMGESREGERYKCRRIGVDVAAVEGGRGGSAARDASALPNMESARVLLSCWKALP